MSRNAITIGIAVLFCSVASAATVTFYLDSPQAGQTIPPGSTVQWSISLGVSTGDNSGLALFAADLVQGTSQAQFDIPMADPASIPAIMAGFNRPGGITNPGEGSAASGYVGVQRGDPGAMNLIQIGGGQNTFGSALPPGTGMAEDANVESGIGQGAEPQLVVAGSFSAPATQGACTFSLANVLANVLTAVNPPPAFSPVEAAAVNVDNASFSFTVGVPGARGDLNCDGAINALDINPFVKAMTNLDAYYAQFPNCNHMYGDIDCSGAVNALDINPFVQCITGGECPPCP